MSNFGGRRRVILDRKIKHWGRVVQWAAGKDFDTLVLPLRFLSRLQKKDLERLEKMAGRSNMTIEAGGWDLSYFVPRRLFLFHRDMFRMAEGKRRIRYNFCPTNPATIERLKNSARRLVKRLSWTPPVLHLWPDREREGAWCSCPACRAFSPAEQNLIAVNSIAGVLSELWADTRISYLDLSENQADAALKKEPAAAGIKPRSNTFAIKTAPPCLSSV